MSVLKLQAVLHQLIEALGALQWHKLRHIATVVGDYTGCTSCSGRFYTEPLVALDAAKCATS
jgi:hypothetical protein